MVEGELDVGLVLGTNATRRGERVLSAGGVAIRAHCAGVGRVLTRILPRELTAAGVRRLAREATWVVTGQAMAILGGIVGVRLLTELLTPETYGEVALGMTLATLLNQVVFGPLANGASRFYSIALETHDLPTYGVALKRLTLSATRWVLFGAGLAAIGLIITSGSRWLGLAMATGMFALLSGYNGILDAMQNAARQRAVVAWHQTLSAWGRFLLPAGLVALVGPTSDVAMAGCSVAAALVLGSQLRMAKLAMPGHTPVPAASPQGDRWGREIRSYSWPFAAWGWLTFLQQASDRWALQFFGSTEAVGQYAVIYQLGCYPIVVASGMAMQLVGPVLFEKSGPAVGSTQHRFSIKVIYSMTLWTGVLTIALFTVLGLSHERLFGLLVATSYRHASFLLPWVALAAGVFAAGQILSLSFMAGLNPRALLAAKVVTALVGMVANLAGAWARGLVGVVIANVVWALLYLLVIMACAHKERNRVAGRTQLDHKKYSGDLPS